MSKYQFYPSLLDKFQSYLNADIEAQQPWNKDKSEEEVHDKLHNELLDSINRVPHEPIEAAVKGTAFNAVVDLLCGNPVTQELYYTEPYQNKKGVLVRDVSIKESGITFDFSFQESILQIFVESNRGASTQVFCEGDLETSLGNVRLYGYADAFKYDVCIDIKTTSQYEFSKYRKGWQRLVYPYCLTQMGFEVNSFEFQITDFRSIYKEEYIYDHSLAQTSLRNICEDFIQFLETNRNLITDKKIFNE